MAADTHRPHNAGYICTTCGALADSLFRTYPSFIRMTECVHIFNFKECGSYVDKYVEYDSVLIVIDLVLQYAAAYRHLLYNKGITHFPRLLTIFLFCGAYEKWIQARAGQERIFDLEWRFYGCLLGSIVEIGIAVGCALLLEILVNRSTERASFVAKATVAGFYGQVFVVLSIIFRLYSEPSYRILTQLFLLVSHFQITHAIHPTLSSPVAAVSVIISSFLYHFAGVLTHHIFEHYITL